MNAAKNLLRETDRNNEALKRYRIISPLLDDELDPAAYAKLKSEAAEKNGISERTVRRYVSAFNASGFDGLKPAVRKYYKKGVLPDNYDDILAQAIQLRREVPGRSIEQIILILELEGRVGPGVLKRSTLQAHIQDAGYSRTQMEVYRSAEKGSSRRFCKPHRMMLIQGDIKYGLMLPIGENGKKVQTYLSSAIDDHSRYVLASKFYDNQEECIVEDTFHTAILKYGRFDRAYFDNGSQYIARQLKLSLAKLSIRISHAPVNSGRSKGKIEKFHQVVDRFLDEAKAKKIRTLEELNRYWTIFLEEYYHNDPHDGIREYYESKGITVPGEGITPLQEFNRDTRGLTYLDTKLVNEAFLYHDTRKVDKGGCISFQNRQYEAKAELIGQQVEIAYDPNAPETITISYPGTEPFVSKPLNITGYNDRHDPLPQSKDAIEPETSRFLDALEKEYEKNRQRRADAISFGGYRKEVPADV